jgi:hypothetical protein
MVVIDRPNRWCSSSNSFSSSRGSRMIPAARSSSGCRYSCDHRSLRYKASLLLRCQQGSGPYKWGIKRPAPPTFVGIVFAGDPVRKPSPMNVGTEATVISGSKNILHLRSRAERLLYRVRLSALKVPLLMLVLGIGLTNCANLKYGNLNCDILEGSAARMCQDYRQRKADAQIREEVAELLKAYRQCLQRRNTQPPESRENCSVYIQPFCGLAGITGEAVGIR